LVGLSSSLRRDSCEKALRFRSLLALGLGGWAWRFSHALYERFKTLRRRSAFACIARQSLKRFFWGLGFLHEPISHRRVVLSCILLGQSFLTGQKILCAGADFGTEKSRRIDPFIVMLHNESVISTRFSGASFVGGREI